MPSHKVIQIDLTPTASPTAIRRSPKMSIGPVTNIPLLPPEIEQALSQFLANHRTGNIQVNIKDGEILGAHVTEIITPKPNRPRVIGHGKVRTSKACR